MTSVVMFRQLVLWLFVLLVLICRTESAFSVMSIDLGNEWMKIAIVKPGVPMEIVLNKESRRKTPTVVSLKNGERLFGEAAAAVSVKYPKFAYGYLLDVLGKPVDHPIVQNYQKRFPYYSIVPHESRRTVLFQHPDGAVYSPEELLAMILSKAREYAQDFAEQAIKDAVITVPAYFNQAERRALLNAAEIAGLNVLQLINDNSAVALHYGVFRRNTFNATAQNIMFYDMGATSTVATIVAYQLVKTKEEGTIPQLTVKGVGYDRTLGGMEMQMRLRAHLLKLFNQHKKTSSDVASSPRAMAKLFKEAGRLKNVLSANTEHKAQVEGLIDDEDFHAHVTRAEYEEVCHDLFDRVAGPVHQALESSQMSVDEIDQVIIVGGSTRTPSVQDILLKTMKLKDLGKSVNADEAIALGAVYQAAEHSKTFKVKKFGIRNGNLYPIQVQFQREKEDGQKGEIRTVKRTLFGHMNTYPQKKVLTFNKYFNDFDFKVIYGDANILPQQDRDLIVNHSVITVALTGVQESLAKHNDEKSSFKGIKAHFKMDDSGILSLDSVEAAFEKEIEVAESESTFSKLGKTFSSLFGGDSKTSDDDKNTTETAGTQNDTETNTEETRSKVSEGNTTANETIEKGEQNKTETTANDTAKIETIKEVISAEQSIVDVLEMTEEIMDASKAVLKELNDKDAAKAAVEKARNSVESFIVDFQSKLYEESFEAVTTENERDSVRSVMSEVGDWLYEDGSDETIDVYKDKLKELETLTRDISFRERELTQRPTALQALKDLLNFSNTFLAAAKIMPEEAQIYTEVEISTLEKVHNETRAWKSDMEIQQSHISPTETPVLLISDIGEKFAALDREVKYLLNKAKYAKPKKKPADNKTKVNETEAAVNETVIGDETVSTEETESVVSEGNGETPEETEDGVRLDSVDEKLTDEADSHTDSTNQDEDIGDIDDTDQPLKTEPEHHGHEPDDEL